MAKPSENRENDPENCKTAEPASPFSRTWMARFLAGAADGDVSAGLTEAGVSRLVYLRGRREDAAFDAACTEVDLVVRASIQGAIEAAASGGNVSAAKLLTKGLGKLEPAKREDEMPPHVAAAMIAAGLQAFSEGPPERPIIQYFDFLCPACSACIEFKLMDVYGPHRTEVRVCKPAHPLRKP